MARLATVIQSIVGLIAAHDGPKAGKRLFRFVVAAVTVGVFVALALGAPAAPSGSDEKRYRLNVELEVDGKIYSGSTVWDLSATFNRLSLDAYGPTLDVRGEAIDFELADGETLFVLRRGVSGPPTRAFGGQFLVCVPGETTYEMADALSAFSGSCEVRLFPKVVLADKSGNLTPLTYDPKTKTGPRVTIVSTFAAATDDPVEFGIVDRHPWIAKLPTTASGGRSDTTYFEDFSRR